eukprot:6944831-Ditylum_brightwellii.AAC.1
MHNLQLSMQRGGMMHKCRFLEPSWIFLGGSGGLGCKGAIYTSVLGGYIHVHARQDNNVPVTPYEKGGLNLMQLGVER